MNHQNCEKEIDFKVENDNSLHFPVQDVAKRCFYKWHKRCANRALLTEYIEFEQEDSSSDESIENTLETDGATGNIAFQKEEMKKDRLWKSILKYRLPASVNPETDNIYVVWQLLASICLVYNAICLPLRACFPYQSVENMPIWLAFDYVADVVYFIDMTTFQVRRQYLNGGCIEDDPVKTRVHYLRSRRFKCDILSLFPTDLLYLFFGVKPLFRINRLLKLDSYFEFNNMFEMMLKQAYIFRVARTVGYLLYIIHLDACLYYYISYLKDFKSEWGYQLEGIAYVRCYFWSFMTITTIGNVPDPILTSEYILQLVHYFCGLFIFSIVIGQVRDSVQAATAEADDYRTKKNACYDYMQKNDIPINIQKKVRLWFEYTWNTQKILDENALLRQMPGKMHTELAINVHMDVLSKVEIFKECDKQLLYDLLIKLQPILYLPGDYVCKKGEVGREMYIITNGMVQVVGDKKSQVFASLYPGTAFGEISLLAIGGGNRRTANIYSPGYTTLFILYKQDLNETLQNYPEAQHILRKKAKKMLNKDKTKKKPIIMSSVVSKSTHRGGNTNRFADLLSNVKKAQKSEGSQS